MTPGKLDDAVEGTQEEEGRGLDAIPTGGLCGAACGVLVVDDEADIREMVQIVLESAGCRACLVANGEAALARLRGGDRPCLILLDLRMPRMNGLELHAALQRDEELARIPVVMLSGDGRARDVEQLKGTEYLLKPVDLDELVAAVRRHCPANR